MIIKTFEGLQDYQTIWQQMQDYTNTRDESSEDQIWFLEHHPVFTQGQAGKAEHILNPGDIPVIQTDRGGQVTYHGPGQLVTYILVDIKRANIGVRQLVTHVENAVIATLAEYNIESKARVDAPGVYVENGAKICSLGLRIRRGCSYHGLALNVAMNLQPFSRINPCGLQNIKMTQIQAFQSNVNLSEVKEILTTKLSSILYIPETVQDASF